MSVSPFDIRLPIGGLFTVLGLLVSGYGLATTGDGELYARSLSINVNLWWGVVMLAFGVGLLLSATFYAGRAGVRPASETPEGRAMERREHRTGLEH